MYGVGVWFQERGEIPLVAPYRLREYAPLADDPDRTLPEACADSICGAAFVIEYCDSRGWVSTRLIRCLRIDRRPPASLHAFCNVRKTVRTFRLDRIISILSLRTGAVMSGDAHMALFAPHLDSSDAGADAAATLQEAARDGVFVLLQLAMADGRLDDAARDIVWGYVAAEAAAARCAAPEESVALWIDNLAPPLEAVLASVERLLADKPKLVRVLPWLMKLMRSRPDFALQEASLRTLLGAIRSHFQSSVIKRPAQLRAIR